VWQEIQRAAEEEYDRSRNCTFKAMIDEGEIGERSDSAGARRGSTDHGRARMKRARQREDSAGRIWSAIRSMVSRMAG
jgi:hypothetical protein